MIFDSVLGRAALKDRIQELESEIERKEAQLAGERDRRAAAVRDRQEADERVNTLKDRIADLEGQLNHAQSREWSPQFRGTETIRGERVSVILDRLDRYRTEDDSVFTAMVADRVPDPVRDVFGDHSALIDRAAPCLAVTDDAGIISVALDPPLPPEPFVAWDESVRFDREWFVPVGSFGFALVRSDVFGYGEYEGREQVFQEGFESSVQGRHSKGGFSQSRFERRRDEQVERHLERCQEVIEKRDPDRLIVVGEQTVIGRFADGAVRVMPVGASGDPAEALSSAFDEFWSVPFYRV